MKVTKTETTKKYDNKVETAEQGVKTDFFIGLESKGDSVECVYSHSEMIDFKNGTSPKKVHLAFIDGVLMKLPTNYQLNQKLDVVEQMEQKNIELLIEVLGFEKIAGGRKMKLFEVGY